MKFILGFLPTLPVTMEQRLRERPIGYRTEYWQRMLDQIVEIARVAEDVGFDIASFTEHHLHTEGLEIGSVPSLSLYTAMHTKHLKVGPIGYVLPGWNPLRLAVEIGWLDQMTKGRSIVGMARGYQTRWLNSMAQKLHVQAAPSDQSEVDILNRKVFEEVFQILKLAWKEEAFSFKGEFWEYPYPYEEGTPWKAHEWTAKYGAPGEIDGRPGQEDIGGAQALSKAASTVVPGFFHQRRHGGLVRTREYQRGASEPARVASPPPVRTLSERSCRRGPQGRTRDKASPARIRFRSHATRAKRSRWPNVALAIVTTSNSAECSASGKRSACPKTKRSIPRER